jgi:hypothetical protein
MVKQVRKQSGGNDTLKILKEKLINEQLEIDKLYEVMSTKRLEADVAKAAKANINPLKSMPLLSIFSCF